MSSEEEEIILQKFEEYRKDQVNALTTGEIFHPSRRYAYRSFGNWLVYQQCTNLIQFLCPYQHLFFECVEDYGEMHLAIEYATISPKMFQCMYSKGIRKTGWWDMYGKDRSYVDTFDGGIPYALIANNATEALKWYVQLRKKEDTYYQRYLMVILSWYYEFSRDLHGDDKELTRFLMKTMASERVNMYKEELIQTTWHPNRVTWWMDHEEYTELFTK